MLHVCLPFLIICLQEALVCGKYSCDEKQRNICNHLSQLQTEVDAVTADLRKWNNHYGFLQGLHANFRTEIASIVEDVIAKKSTSDAVDLRTDEIMGKINTIEETVASIRSHQTDTENTIRAIQLQLQEVYYSCLGDPPPIHNGEYKKFERTIGSIVQYECEQNYVLTKNSTVFCSSDGWKGLPPVCSYFDVTFTLKNVKNLSRVITCYSDENYDTVEFHRVRASQKREDLSRSYNYSQNPRGKYARLEVPSSLKYGAYECENGAKHGPMSILLLKEFTNEDFIPLEQFKVVNVGDTVELEIERKNYFNLPIRWKHNGEAVPSWNDRLKVEIPNVKHSDAGFYEGHYEHRRGSDDNTFMRLIVRKCKANMYGKYCDQTCPACYNGGICHDDVGVCVCPEGFTGTNCEIACDGGRFGVNCSKFCDGVGEEACIGHTFCKPDPLGCACATGFKGKDCRDKCELGKYGVNCKQPCHCAGGYRFCNTFTGACRRGCSSGWRGDSCQIEDRK